MTLTPKSAALLPKLLRLHLDTLAGHARRSSISWRARLRRQNRTARSFSRCCAHDLRAASRLVNGGALTAWKAGHLWQFCMSTSNFMDRSVDKPPPSPCHRSAPSRRRGYATLVPAAPARRAQADFCAKAFRSAICKPVCPSRFAITSKWRSISTRVSVKTRSRFRRQLRPHRGITRDRTRLFVDVAGVITERGMKSKAQRAHHSNDAGVIVDSFQFTDIFRTIELNPTEKDRFLTSSPEVVAQKISVEQLLSAPPPPESAATTNSTCPPSSTSTPSPRRTRLFCKLSRRTCPASCAGSRSPLSSHHCDIR